MCLLAIASTALEWMNCSTWSFSSPVSLKRATSSGKKEQVHKNPVIMTMLLNPNKNFMSEMFNFKFIYLKKNATDL